ncbi:DNA topoisomerase III [Piscinibacterium candidicorallinum]|uniref:DNA topoisomerase n=1 Tax=Piscinibacterium candidicorallinum TaxID=1793872 RepID=A0ABV7H798_9BURK
MPAAKKTAAKAPAAKKAAVKKTSAKAAAATLADGLKTLVIAEKPSVMNDIAKALGGFVKHEDYLESDEYVVSSAVGHLLELVVPEQYDVKRGKWSFAHLPMIPPHFDVQPIEKNEKRLKTLVKLLKRKDVGAVINACDAGREGELIFRYIMQHAKSKLPVQRLWLQSMTPQAIRDGFAQLRTDDQMMPLADAARCRSEADWLVGINGTRAMTAFNSKDGGFFLTTVGRVQTPTLAIVVEREERIRKFVPRDFWEVRAEFVAAGGVYEGRWFDPKFKKDETDPEKRESRLWAKAAAESIVAACRSQMGSVTEEAKPSTQGAPLLYDLTSLQRESNGRFGFSAQTTLSIAQALYEKHKVLTYPRTDSRYLPQDYVGTVEKTLEQVGEMDRYYPFTAQALNKGWVKGGNKRVFDNTKVSDHFAIIPTGNLPKGLSEAEAKVYDLVTKRFIAVFFPPAEYQITTRITEVQGHQFKTEGKVLVNPGWLAVYGKDEQKSDDSLVAVKQGERVVTETIEAVGLSTKPPPRYNEATLLSAMEGAGKLVEDEELREAMAERGLGTPATRAATIEGLLNEKYMLREGRDLMPTAKAFQLMTLLRGLGVEELTQPQLTGGWEHKLSLMEKGEISREEFMQEIARMTQIIVKRAKEYDRDTVPGDYATLKTPCPHCGSVVKENYRRFACEACGFSISKHPGGRSFEIEEVEELLEKRTIGPLQGFRSKMGRPFAAILNIVEDTENNNLKMEFDFGQSNAEDEDAEAPDFSGQSPLGKCPRCGGGVHEHGMNYVCENTVVAKTCTFKSGKVILQQEISPEQVKKLLDTGKTDLLTGFVSMRTRRPFKAFLAWDAKADKVGFEFAPREAKAPAKKGAKKAAEAAE